MLHQIEFFFVLVLCQFHQFSESLLSAVNANPIFQGTSPQTSEDSHQLSGFFFVLALTFSFNFYDKKCLKHKILYQLFFICS